MYLEKVKPEELLKAYNLTAQDIVNKVKEAIILKINFNIYHEQLFTLKLRFKIAVFLLSNKVFNRKVC